MFAFPTKTGMNAQKTWDCLGVGSHIGTIWGRSFYGISDPKNWWLPAGRFLVNPCCCFWCKNLHSCCLWSSAIGMEFSNFILVSSKLTKSMKSTDFFSIPQMFPICCNFPGTVARGCWGTSETAGGSRCWQLAEATRSPAFSIFFSFNQEQLYIKHRGFTSVWWNELRF